MSNELKYRTSKLIMNRNQRAIENYVKTYRAFGVFMQRAGLESEKDILWNYFVKVIPNILEQTEERERSR